MKHVAKYPYLWTNYFTGTSNMSEEEVYETVKEIHGQFKKPYLFAGEYVKLQRWYSPADVRLEQATTDGFKLSERIEEAIKKLADMGVEVPVLEPIAPPFVPSVEPPIVVPPEIPIPPVEPPPPPPPVIPPPPPTIPVPTPPPVPPPIQWTSLYYLGSSTLQLDSMVVNGNNIWVLAVDTAGYKRAYIFYSSNAGQSFSPINTNATTPASFAHLYRGRNLVVSSNQINTMFGFQYAVGNTFRVWGASSSGGSWTSFIYEPPYTSSGNVVGSAAISIDNYGKMFISYSSGLGQLCLASCPGPGGVWATNKEVGNYPGYKCGLKTAIIVDGSVLQVAYINSITATLNIARCGNSSSSGTAGVWSSTPVYALPTATANLTFKGLDLVKNSYGLNVILLDTVNKSTSTQSVDLFTQQLTTYIKTNLGVHGSQTRTTETTGQRSRLLTNQSGDLGVGYFTFLSGTNSTACFKVKRVNDANWLTTNQQDMGIWSGVHGCDFGLSTVQYMIGSWPSKTENLWNRSI